MIGATTADADSNEAEPDPLLKIFRRGVQEGHEAVVEDMRALFGSITPQYEQRLHSLDLQAMVALIEYYLTDPAWKTMCSKSSCRVCFMRASVT